MDLGDDEFAFDSETSSEDGDRDNVPTQEAADADGLSSTDSGDDDSSDDDDDDDDLDVDDATGGSGSSNVGGGAMSTLLQQRRDRLIEAWESAVSSGSPVAINDAWVALVDNGFPLATYTWSRRATIIRDTVCAPLNRALINTALDACPPECRAQLEWARTADVRVASQAVSTAMGAGPPVVSPDATWEDCKRAVSTTLAADLQHHITYALDTLMYFLEIQAATFCLPARIHTVEDMTRYARRCTNETLCLQHADLGKRRQAVIPSADEDAGFDDVYTVVSPLDSRLGGKDMFVDLESGILVAYRSVHYEEQCAKWASLIQPACDAVRALLQEAVAAFYQRVVKVPSAVLPRVPHASLASHLRRLLDKHMTKLARTSSAGSMIAALLLKEVGGSFEDVQAAAHVVADNITRLLTPHVTPFPSDIALPFSNVLPKSFLKKSIALLDMPDNFHLVTQRYAARDTYAGTVNVTAMVHRMYEVGVRARTLQKQGSRSIQEAISAAAFAEERHKWWLSTLSVLNRASGLEHEDGIPFSMLPCTELDLSIVAVQTALKIVLGALAMDPKSLLHVRGIEQLYQDIAGSGGHTALTRAILGLKLDTNISVSPELVVQTLPGDGLSMNRSIINFLPLLETFPFDTIGHYACAGIAEKAKEVLRQNFQHGQRAARSQSILGTYFSYECSVGDHDARNSGLLDGMMGPWRTYRCDALYALALAAGVPVHVAFLCRLAPPRQAMLSHRVLPEWASVFSILWDLQRRGTQVVVQRVMAAKQHVATTPPLVYEGGRGEHAATPGRQKRVRTRDDGVWQPVTEWVKCPWCVEDVHVGAVASATLPGTDGCSCCHVACLACMVNYVEKSAASVVFKVSDSHVRGNPLKCYEPACPGVIAKEFVDLYVSSVGKTLLHVFAQRIASEKALVETTAAMRLGETAPNLVCRVCSCVAPTPADNTVFTCSWCENRMCVQCGETSHPGEVCVVKLLARDGSNAMNVADLLTEVKTVACPTCGVMVSKTEGCNHMTCTNRLPGTDTLCNTDFCYLCSKKLVRDNVGLHYSENGGTCLQFEDISPESETTRMANLIRTTISTGVSPFSKRKVTEEVALAAISLLSRGRFVQDLTDLQ